MIHATLLTNNIVSVEIDNPNFAVDLERFQAKIDVKDRRWDPVKRIWFVTCPEKYRSLPFIDGAFTCQTKSLFPETAESRKE